MKNFLPMKNAALMVIALMCSMASFSQNADSLIMTGQFDAVLPAMNPQAAESDSATVVITSYLGREIPVHVTNGAVYEGSVVLTSGHGAYGGIMGAAQFTAPDGVGTFSYGLMPNPLVDPQPPIALFVNGDSIGIDSVNNNFAVNVEGEVELSFQNADAIRVKGGVFLLWLSWTDYPVTSTEDMHTQVFKCYPNPVKDLLFYENVPGIQQISVMDLTGRKVKSVKNPVENQLDLSSLGQGIYLVTLHTKRGEIYTSKVIKE
jgi:hypothetical protein